MLNIKTIQTELNKILDDRLEEVYDLVSSFRRKVKSEKNKQSNNIRFAGIFNDLSKTDYEEFLLITKKSRELSFDRNIQI